MLVVLLVSADCPDFRLEPDPLSSFVPPPTVTVVVGLGWPVEGCCVDPVRGGYWPGIGDSATVLRVHTVYMYIVIDTIMDGH